MSRTMFVLGAVSIAASVAAELQKDPERKGFLFGVATTTALVGIWLEFSK